jgi:hypothetical protein
MDHIIKIGDLVSIEPWDCEGIELPYGFKVHDKHVWDPMKKQMLESLIGRVKITAGSKGFVTGREYVTIRHAENIMFWCLVEGQHLIISQHFVNRI